MVFQQDLFQFFDDRLEETEGTRSQTHMIYDPILDFPAYEPMAQNLNPLPQPRRQDNFQHNADDLFDLDNRHSSIQAFRLGDGHELHGEDPN